MKYQIIQGDNRETLKTIPDNSIDAIVTDPPYGIDFLGKDWDVNTGELETYQQCLRVLKPGGYILAFSAPRTYHHLAMTLERAGFEIRDQIMWIYSSGFPKSQDVGRQIQRSIGVKETKLGNPNRRVKKNFDPNTYDHGGLKEKITGDVVCVDPAAKAWEGWGTSLKPAHEPICLARKPMKLSIAKNCQTHGVGALNIDATRIPYDDGQVIKGGAKIVKMDEAWSENLDKTSIAENNWTGDAQGRFPSNVIGEIPDYQKYFYCPKVGRKERHMGFDNNVKTHWEMAEEMGGSLVDHEGKPTRSGNKALIPGVGDIYTHSLSKKYEDWCKNNNKPMPNSGNNHPTVKPVELMKYLIKLITPPGGTVLDPFNGSGSTGMAAVELGHPYIGLELDPKYVDIARTRIEAWTNSDTDNTTFDQLFEQ